MRQVLCQVISQAPVMPGVSLAWFESPEIAQSAKPGQFVMVKCGEETFLRRPLSIYQTDAKNGKFALLYAKVGKGTQWLSEQQANSYVDILGPLGNDFTIYPKSRNLLLIAGRMGLAPLNFLAIEAQKKGCSVTIKQGSKDFFHVFKDEFKPAKVTFLTVTEDGSAGEKGLVIDGLSELLKQTDQIFACGPAGMYQAMAQMPELKNKPVQISLEIMMGCGAGVCYGCTIKTKNGLKQVCKDGPVFELRDIIWEELKGI
jgi:dihydroorotate dehydrogenase electron transfer subunit